MPFQASSLAIVQSTRMRKTSPACTYGRGKLTACCARIFCVSVMGLTAGDDGEDGDGRLVVSVVIDRVPRCTNWCFVCSLSHGWSAWEDLTSPRPPSPHGQGGARLS